MNNDHNAQAAKEPRVQSLQQYVRSMLAPKFGLVFTAMTDHLFNLSASAQLTPEGRSHCFEAFSTLKVQSKSLTDDLLAQIDQSYLNLIETRAVSGDAKSIPAELDLVDLDEFENSLAIDRIVKAGSERYWVQLEALTLRLAEIIGEDPLRVRLPFGLRGLCTGYRTVIQPLNFTDEIIVELDKAFARNLLPELGGLYADINKKLEADGLLPDVEKQLESSGSQLAPKPKAPPRPAPRPGAQASPQATEDTQLNQPIPPDTGIPTGAPLQASQLAGVGSPSAAALRPLEMGELRPSSFLESTAPLVAPSPLDEAAAAEGFNNFLPGHGSPAAGNIVDAGVLNRLRQGGGYGVGVAEALPESELRAVATELAGEIASLRQKGLKVTANSPRLTEQFGLENLGRGADPLRGSLQLVDNLYDTMLETLPLSPGLEESLHSLKLPLAQLSLIDPDFYHNREHPARLLVERLSEVSALAPKNNARLEKKLDDVLSEVNTSYNGDNQIFDQALAKVTDLALSVLRQQQRNIQRQVAAEDGKEKRQQARRQVDTTLVARLPATQLPATMLSLIDVLLRDELTLHLLRDGENQSYVLLLDAMVAVNEHMLAIHGGEPAEGNDEATRLVEAVRAQLDNAQFLSPQQDALLQQAERELAGNEPVRLIDSTLGTFEMFAEPVFSERLRSLPRLARWVRRARELPLNAWVAETHADGTTRNLQLIWKNALATRFAFANEQGQLVRDLDLIELARWLGRHLRPLTPSEQLSIIEKSVFSTLERTQEDLARTSRSPTEDELTRAALVDQAQSMLRRARRKGASHCAVAIHADGPEGIQQVLSILEASNIEISARGELSPTTRGVIAQVGSSETLQEIFQRELDNSESAGIGITPIDANHSSADDLWQSVEETAKRGLSLSPNTGVVSQQESRPTDLAGAVRKTYSQLRDEMPPRFSLRRVQRSMTANPAITEPVFQVLLDGSPHTSADLSKQTGYHSAALAIALDCVKINATCRFAEQLIGAGREVPVFNLRVSTDSALHHEFLDFVLNEVSDSGIGTDRLCIELRDSARLREEGRVADFAQTLRSIGCQIMVCEVHPSRGSTSQLQTLGPHMLALDASLWPPQDADDGATSLHQAISDLHHLVGEHVVLRDERERTRAAQLGIDFIELFETEELAADAVRELLPAIQR